MDWKKLWNGIKRFFAPEAETVAVEVPSGSIDALETAKGGGNHGRWNVIRPHSRRRYHPHGTLPRAHRKSLRRAARRAAA